MHVTLRQPFAQTGKVDAFDVLQLKKALNRLGYYQPPETAGITDLADTAIFAALKEFQTDQELPATGATKPNDETTMALNRAIAQTPPGYYLWRCVEDGKARAAHAKFNRTYRMWSNAPDPGEDFNCRCWAEPIPPSGADKYTDAINSTIGPFDLLSGGNLIKQSLRLSLFSSKGTTKEFRLTSEQRKNLARFAQKISANSKDTIQIIKLRNSNVKYTAHSAGRVPGSKSIYEKTVNSNGETVSYKKITYDQYGNIAHVKIKYPLE